MWKNRQFFVAKMDIHNFIVFSDNFGYLYERVYIYIGCSFVLGMCEAMYRIEYAWNIFEIGRWKYTWWSTYDIQKVYLPFVVLENRISKMEHILRSVYS